jgi:hypothetical protein
MEFAVTEEPITEEMAAVAPVHRVRAAARWRIPRSIPYQAIHSASPIPANLVWDPAERPPR